MCSGVAQAQSGASDWEVRPSAALDLWYYGLAAVRFTGPGSLSYYNPAFLAALRAERRSRGLSESPLEMESARFGDAFRRDTVFEALHFLPLYYSGDDGSQLIASLQSLSANGNALAPVFPTSAERQTLRQFAAALDAERPYLTQSRVRAKLIDDQLIAKLDAQWKSAFLPALSPYLRELGVRRGVLLVSPALGSEGRIVRIGDAEVIAVGMDNSVSPTAPLFAAVRELCFPLVDRIKALTAEAASRLAAIDMTNRAATRCGAMLLDISNATMAAEYRRIYLESTPDERSLSRNFDARFPLTRAIEKSLRDEIGRVMLATRTIER
jgi:hypothetical protein